MPVEPKCRFAVVVAQLDPAVVVSPLNGGMAAHAKFVAFVKLSVDGVPKLGLTSVGDVARTTVLPEPVVVANIGCALPFEAITAAEVGNAVPLIFEAFPLCTRTSQMPDAP